jgi:hypothetical protein
MTFIVGRADCIRVSPLLDEIKFGKFSSHIALQLPNAVAEHCSLYPGRSPNNGSLWFLCDEINFGTFSSDIATSPPAVALRSQPKKLKTRAIAL